MAKKKTKTIVKKKSSLKYPWEDSINTSNDKKESSLCMRTLDGDKFNCFISFMLPDDTHYTLNCIGPNGIMFLYKFKILSSAKKFAEKELEKRFNMKNMSFN